jgi:hypothetical protein
MLVHVSRFVDVHDVVHRQVQRYLDVMRALIAGGDRCTLERLQRLWDTDFVPTGEAVRRTVFGRRTDPLDWAVILERLSDSSDRIRVVVTNGRSKAGLDYKAYGDSGLSVIAIGGDKLSRGLTLEGLTVSYFLRISKQYDSLLQMGRWFGYRRGFADVCRLYTTPDMEDWFRHVATANKELRSEIAQMQLMLATPKEYGLRVAGHSIMSVTAANKQRYALERSVGYAGEGKIQTVMFREPGIVEQNAVATEVFIEALDSNSVLSPRRPGTGVLAKGELWSSVPGRTVAAYLRSLNFPPESNEIAGGRLAGYIEDQIRVGELTEWVVFLAAGDRGIEVELAGRRFPSVQRSPRTDSSTSTRFIIKSVLNPPDEAIDLADDEFAEALRLTNKERRLEDKPETDRPAGPCIRAVRAKRPQNGLLLIYPLDPVLAEAGTARPLIGVVVSFPESDTALKRLYLENTVRQREQAW